MRPAVGFGDQVRGFCECHGRRVEGALCDIEKGSVFIAVKRWDGNVDVHEVPRVDVTLLKQFDQTLGET